MKITKVGDALNWDAELEPGIGGYAIEHDGAIYIPIIMAKVPGRGDVSRFLDNLPKDKVIKFPNVLNEKLAGMLKRRGFVEESEWDDDEEMDIPMWVRRPER